MKTNCLHLSQIYPDLFLHRGAATTGILRWGERAILIDCDDTLTQRDLAENGINKIERIYCTQHRRLNTDGIKTIRQPTTRIFAPFNEMQPFIEAESYWNAWHNRWHLYHARPGLLAPLANIPLSGYVCHGERIHWGNFTLQVIDTPGITDGSVSYFIENPPNPPVIFCGDTLYACGQVWDVHSLQKGMGGTSDYHGYLGAAEILCASLTKLKEVILESPDPDRIILIPSHGDVINPPLQALDLTCERLHNLLRNYAATSALNYYFPMVFAHMSGDPLRMPPAQTFEFPAYIRPVAATSFAIISETGGVFLIDCGSDTVLEVLKNWKQAGIFSQVEGCWVTHYHDDHVDALHHLATTWPQASIYADNHVAEILRHPQRYILPCISPVIAPDISATRDGDTWTWHEYQMTALHFPGQSFYHGGLVVSGHNQTILFCGDSFAPTGLDDYTAGNRNFLGAGRGFRRCIELIRHYMPDLILNQHQKKAFRFTKDQLDTMEQMLITRESLLSVLLPWDNINFGTDEHWARTYPYEVEVLAGCECRIEMHFTNHNFQATEGKIEPVLPSEWSINLASSQLSTQVGSQSECCIKSTRFPPDGKTTAAIMVPEQAAPGIYPIPFRIWWGGKYLGQFRHAMVHVI